ncbi:class I adenylate-forming enzyme family protein [Dactylosporangium sp. NPDC051485]|uniref:class I adenylate-forming enzyme family protein n=1 Tax=Dactylosporangium sp. NPDC051485 TaxID=3154846 RepID=UPI00343DA2F3
MIPTEIHRHPGLAYEIRPRRITAVLDEARRWGDRPFITQGRRVLTFDDHARMVDDIAAQLRFAGVRERDRVAIFAANSPEWVATFFATLAVGAVVVPCNGWWSAEEMAHACEVVEPSIVISDGRCRERVPPGLPVLLTADLAAGGGPAGRAPSPVYGGDGEQDEDDPAVILFTAGTTSFPKGATLSHRALVSNLQTLLVVSRKLPHQIGDDIAPSVTLVGLPLFHIGAIQLILVPPMTGSQIVFLEGRFDPGAVLEEMETHRVTMFSGVPTMMERLLAHPDVARRDLASVRTVVLGGSPVDDSLLERVRRAFPGTHRGVGQTYGLTEAGGLVSTGVGAQIAAHPGSSGRLVPVVEARVDDPDASGNGRLFIRSPAAMDGYWGWPDDPTIDADGWLDTGDIGRVDADGYLYITGRAKEVIIRGGENIAPARVESVLAEHPAVAEVAVVGLPDPDLGEIVAAAVTLTSTGAASSSDLEVYARGRLAHFAVPQRWWLRTEPLPTNDAGKILKHVLVAWWPDQEQAAA